MNKLTISKLCFATATHNLKSVVILICVNLEAKHFTSIMRRIKVIFVVIRVEPFSAGTVFIRQNLTSIDVFIRQNLTSVDARF